MEQRKHLSWFVVVAAILTILLWFYIVARGSEATISWYAWVTQRKEFKK